MAPRTPLFVALPLRCWALGGLLTILAVMVGNSPIHAADFRDTESKFLTGKYDEATEVAASQVEEGIWNERWPRLLIKCQMATGQYADAKKTYLDAIGRYPMSLTLRLQGIDVLRHNNLPEEAAEADRQFFLLLQSSTSRFASRDNLIAAGRYFASKGEDAKKVLNLFFDRVRNADPTFIQAYLSTAELALDKGDFKVAADTLQDAQQTDPNDARISYLLARAWQPSDSEKATAALNHALSINPNHIPSLLLQAETLIDREAYDDAEEKIDHILTINAHDQNAWALLAVLAHLRGKYEIEKLMRAAALSTWSDNPQVDHLIGKKLSRKYRFAQAAEYQRKALELDPSFTPARFELAQDLLRLGHDTVGWQLASTVADEDPYNVVAHNLATLRDRVAKFKLLEQDDILVRMESVEAEIYGQDVLDLLTEAKQVLCTKYDMQPTEPIVVEIFPQQKDFAIRTFGLPGGAGYLGVCFGRVITANSPASQGERPANWKSVLWHEFCHVVTLEKTRNRMPRWLSEGISVYEERQRDASWGEKMTPRYREMLLADDLPPVSQLSGAFMNPPSPIHLQFAYYESSLVVEFIVDKYGMDALKQILVDLGDGLAINDALAKNVGSVDKLDSQFKDYARKVADDFAPKADWSRDELPEQPKPQELVEWVKNHPTNYWGLRGLADAFITAEQFDLAKPHLEALVQLDAVTGVRGGPLEMLAVVYRNLDDTKAERDTLDRIATLSSDPLPTLRRLIELSVEEENWEKTLEYAEKYLAIQPLLPDGHQAFASAASAMGQHEPAVRSLQSMAAMDPVDPAAIEFRIAQAQSELGNVDLAKQHVLNALEVAPRYRDALRLLLTIEAQSSETDVEDEAASDEAPEPETATKQASSDEDVEQPEEAQ